MLDLMNAGIPGCDNETLKPLIDGGDFFFKLIDFMDENEEVIKLEKKAEELGGLNSSKQDEIAQLRKEYFDLIAAQLVNAKNVTLDRGKIWYLGNPFKKQITIYEHAEIFLK